MTTTFAASQVVTTRLRIGHLLMLLLFCAVFICISAKSYAQTLTARVDRDVISLQETFTLTLRQSGQANDSPDLTVLQKDFEILNTQQSSQVINVNGQVESYTDWRIALAPKKSGVFTIPALELSGARSEPIIITVEPQSSAPDSASNSVFVEIETDKDSAYVQEQILVTIRLFTAISLNGVELQPLELNDAVVVPLDEKQYQTTLNGRAHAVVETRYAVYPQTSGKLIIPTLAYNVSTGGQRDLWSQIYGGGRRGNLLRLRTEEQQLDILSMPPQFAGTPWLPASEVKLSEHWSASRDNLKVGEPITRSITITAEGLTAGQIAPVTLDNVDGLTFYPDQAQTDEQKTADGVTGTRIETFAIVPNRSGEFTLPAITLNWWDTSSREMKTARLPEAVVTVADNPFAINTPQAATDIPAPQSLPSTDRTTPSPTTGLATPLWLISLTAIACLLALVMSLLYWRARRELAAIHSLDMKDESKLQQAEKNVWNELKRANAAQDYVALRKAVLAWAQYHWQEYTLQSLQAVAARTDNQALREQLTHLDRALYSSGESEKWDSGELLQQIYVCRKQKRDQRQTEEGLKPLYKS